MRIFLITLFLICFSNSLAITVQHTDKYPKPKLQNDSDNLYVGVYDADEHRIIDHDTTINGTIYITGNAELELSGGRISIDGEIFVTSSGRMNAHDCHIHIQQDYMYEHGFLGLENSKIDFENATFTSSGHSFDRTGVGNSVIRHINCKVYDGYITTTMLENSTMIVSNSKLPGEYLAFDNADISFTNSDSILVWLINPDGSSFDLSLPDGDFVENLHISSATPGIESIDCNIALDKCSNVLWGLINESGSDCKFTDTDFRVIGIRVRGRDSVYVSGLTNESNIPNTKIDINDRELVLENCNVRTWNFYSADSARLHIKNCICGEVLADAYSELTFESSVCDGSGGYVSSFNHAQLQLVNSLVQSNLIARENSVLFAVHSSVQGTGLYADEAAIMLLANTNSLSAPVAKDTAMIFDLYLPYINSEISEDLIIEGRASVISGPYNPIEMTCYELEYAEDMENAEFKNISGLVDDAPECNILEEWNCLDVKPGDYRTKLTLYHTYDKLSIGSYMRLKLASGDISVMEPGSMNNQLPDHQLYPNPFSSQIMLKFDEALSSPAILQLYDINGKRAGTFHLPAGLRQHTIKPAAGSKGTYLYRLDSDSNCTEGLILRD